MTNCDKIMCMCYIIGSIVIIGITILNLGS